MRYCVLCNKSYAPGNGTFFRIPPGDPKRIEKWSKICQVELNQNHRICIDHFSNDHFLTTNSRSLLLPNAIPIPPYPQQRAPSTTYIAKQMDIYDSYKVYNENECRTNQNISKSKKDVIIPLQLQEEVMMEIPQEEPTMDIPAEDPIMQIPVIKSVSCAATTQTNTRLCALVEASDFADEFRFNCFYCCEVFSLENWKSFENHIKNNHFKLEAAFNTSEYVSGDHDYTPITTPSSPTAKAKLESKPTTLPSLRDPDNLFETVILHPNSYYKTEGTKALNVCDKKMDNTHEKIMSRYLNTTNEHEEHLEEKEENKSDAPEFSQEFAKEISFEYTPREIVDLLLDSMKSYPVLWQYDEEPFNEDFYEAIEDLCKIINDKYSLNIDNLKMRRIINHILRFYSYFFPNGVDENNIKFACYYDKCATFLPDSANDIAYARCSHCYMCFKNDFDLKLHLFEEQKYLQWPFKCTQCKECFRLSEEYEFHKHLPHYDETFMCEPCNKTFFHRNVYNRHILENHSKMGNDGKYKCNICSKTFRNSSNLRGHKLTHGEKKYKCHICSKSFLVNARLMLHLKGHRKEFDFICEICGTRFIRRSTLRTHMKMHTGEKISCNICNLKLRKSSLSRHLRTVHVPLEGLGEMSRRKYLHYKRLIRSKPVLRIQKKSGDERKYCCKICNIVFENYKLIVEHNKELHSDIQKWPCEICCTEFSHKLNLKGHYRKKHDLNVIQVYKLVDENEDLDVVLALEKENLDELAQSVIVHRKQQGNTAKSIHKTSTKSRILPLPDTFFEIEKIHISTLQDEIMQAADNIEPQEIKMDNDFFKDLLKD